MLGPEGALEVTQFRLFIYRQRTVRSGGERQGWRVPLEMKMAVPKLEPDCKTRLFVPHWEPWAALQKVASSGDFIWYAFFSLGSANVHLLRLWFWVESGEKQTWCSLSPPAGSQGRFPETDTHIWAMKWLQIKWRQRGLLWKQGRKLQFCVFFFHSKRQIQSNGILIYRDIYIRYRHICIYTRPSTRGFSWLHTMAKQKWKTWKKEVDSISMIQPAICYGIQGDSFSHTLA